MHDICYTNIEAGDPEHVKQVGQTKYSRRRSYVTKQNQLFTGTTCYRNKGSPYDLMGIHEACFYENLLRDYREKDNYQPLHLHR